MSYINPDAKLVHYLCSLSKEEIQLELIRANEVIKQAEINYEKKQQEKNKVNFNSIFSFLW